MQKQGDLVQEDFFNNTGGLNLAESPFLVENTQATAGYNYNYTQNGAITKRLAALKINSVATAELLTKGIGIYNPILSEKSVIRAVDAKLQLVDTGTPVFTDLTKDDNTSTTTALDIDLENPIVFEQFNTSNAEVLWLAGNDSLPIGVYSTEKFTINGTTPPSGSISTTVNPTSGGNFQAIGEYYYVVQFRKTSTKAFSNVSLDKLATINSTSDTVTIGLTGITNNDTTLYDKIYIYRSALSDPSGFTVGDLIAQLDSTATTFMDDGSSIVEATNIPRAGNTLLDLSTLPNGEYNALTLFKRRLVTASGNVLYLSEVNQSEAWPLVNYITIPSGGKITGVSVISFTSAQANTLDEILVIFKEREIWVLTGNNFEDYILKFIDAVGCINQPLVIQANGFLSWIDYRGVYLWDGTSKPIFCSRLIEPLFARDGELNKIRLDKSTGQFFRKESTLIWYLSHKVLGDNKYALKLFLPYTLNNITQNDSGRSIKAVFIQDAYTIPVYAAKSYIPSSGNEELMLLGDNAGFMYTANQDTSEGGEDYIFSYSTKFLDLGNPNAAKRFHKVIAWVKELGDWNLILDYWTNFEVKESVKASQALPITDAPQRAVALWDVAYWDIAKWDDAEVKTKPLVFNLNSYSHNNNEGDVIRLQFRNDNQNQPITIIGFSIIYSYKGLAK